ncbi:Glyco-tran-10-N domain-containing protein [Aphelenchoides besseyi]|nr:Glyco-tran-10-N domain-containing protein [Aphelenchoides besseyi]
MKIEYEKVRTDEFEEHQVQPVVKKTGYLGVDIFFVISGYLMCMILLRHEQLTWNDVLDFYYRRIKRIIPTYLFVISAILFTCLLLIVPFEYSQIIKEAIPSLLFYSNDPIDTKVHYFDESSKHHHFFLHTWSLSTELQFYLVVPLIIAIFGLFPSLKFVIIFVLSALSFVWQFTETGDRQHFLPQGRVWQFLFGFVAHFIYKSRLFDIKLNNQVLVYIRELLLFTPLLFLLLIKFTRFVQFQRLFVVLITTLIISVSHSNFSYPDYLVSLGDCSYSVYLVHWPILVFYQFLEPQHYNQKLEHDVGLYIIGFSLLVGYFVEKVFASILRRIKSWPHLLFLTLILYLIAFSLLIALKNRTWRTREEDETSERAQQLRIRDTRMLWQTRHLNLTFSRERTIELNRRISTFHITCTNTTHCLPSNYKNFTFIKHICHEKGDGKKNVVVVGNSHAMFAFLGIVEHFRPIAQSITLIATGGCFLGPLKLQSSNPRECVNFIRTMVRIIQEWKDDIDILIPLFGYDFSFKKPRNARKSEQELLRRSIKSFYSTAIELPTEVIFISSVNVLFPFKASPQLISDLHQNHSVKLKRYQTSRKTQLDYYPGVRRSIEQIKCPICVHVNWMDLWCSKGKRGTCSAIEPRRNILYFSDNHHVTSYGSMFVVCFIVKTGLFYYYADLEYQLENSSAKLMLIIMRKKIRNSIQLAPAKFRSNIDPFCSHKCRYTTDRQLLPSADGVFLQPVEITEDGPNRYSSNQIFFVYLYEAPKHTFNKRLTYLPPHQINYKVGFIPGCDIYAGYGDFPLKNASYFGRETKTPKQTPEEEWERVKSIVLNKTEPAFAVVSHCRTNSHREDYFDTFKLLYPELLNLYGNCYTEMSRSKRDMAKKMATHHFYFAFENAICNGYVTEKFIERARGLVVPVVLRRSDYRTLLPDDSYISADDFDMMHELADYLKYLMKNK